MHLYTHCSEYRLRQLPTGEAGGTPAGATVQAKCPQCGCTNQAPSDDVLRDL